MSAEMEKREREMRRRCDKRENGAMNDEKISNCQTIVSKFHQQEQRQLLIQICWLDKIYEGMFFF